MAEKDTKTKKPVKEGNFPCPFCNHAPFKNPPALNTHIRWKHPKEASGDAVELPKGAIVTDAESVKTSDEKPATVTEAPEKVAPVQKTESPEEAEPVVKKSTGGFDVSMVDPLVRQSGFAEEVTSEIGDVKKDVKEMATAIQGMANAMRIHAVAFEKIDGYLKQLQGGAEIPEGETPSPETTTEETPTPKTTAQEAPNEQPTAKDGLSPEVIAAIVAAQQQTEIPVTGSTVGGSFMPLIDRILKVMEVAKGVPAQQSSPQDNFVKQFLDATSLVSTMRKATIEEMQAMFTSMASFFKSAPKFLGNEESAKAPTEAAKPITHLES